MQTCRVRSETWQLVTKTSPFVLLTGDSGTGKTSVLQESQAEYGALTLAPPPTACLFDSGALQVALLDALSAAMAQSDSEESNWHKLGNRITHASRETALEVGKSLRDALVQELLNLVKSRMGQDVGQSLLAFVKGLRSDDREGLRRDIRSRSDGNVVRLLVRLADEVANVLDRDIVISLDDADRLSDDDQRILAGVAANPPRRVRVIAAYSTARPDALTALDRFRALNCPEVVVEGLSRGDVERWLTAERVAKPLHDRVFELSQGYPLLIEGLVAHINSGGTLERYQAPTVFTAVLNDALQRLPVTAHRAARELSAFKSPLADADIAAYLGIDAVDWGVARSALEAERILSVNRASGKWFHEARRAHLWDTVLSDDERTAIGQKAYTTLLRVQQLGDDALAGSGLTVPIAELARYAHDSQAANPKLKQLIDLSADELAVLAAAIELEGTGIASPTPADQLVIHAHTAFGAPRAQALEALPTLCDYGLLQTTHVGADSDAGPNDTGVAVSLDSEELQVVAHGRIQQVLGKTAIPNLADHVVRTHLEKVRLESYIVISHAGHADGYEMFMRANQFRAPMWFRRVGDPMLGVWLHLGDQPVTIVAVFNTNAELAAAKQEVEELSGTSFGRQLTVDGTFTDPTHTLPTWRLVRVLYYVTGRPVEIYADKNWRLETPQPLSAVECARRQVDALAVLKAAAEPVEREVLGLSQPSGLAVAESGDTTHLVALRGTSRVIELDAGVIESAMAAPSLQFARLEQSIPLESGVNIRTITTQRREALRTNDPVVEDFARLWRKARNFNLRQPPTPISVDPTKLSAALAAAHRRDMRLVALIAERVTVGGQRGHRDQRSLRVVIAATNHHPDDFGGRLAAYALPPGDPDDVAVQFVADPTPADGAALYEAAFGPDEPQTDFYDATALTVIASVLGFIDDEIEFVP